MTQPPSGSHRAGPPPAYGGGPGQPARRPRKRTLLPWLIGAAVLLIAGLGTLLLLLLDGDVGDQQGAGRAAVLTTGQQEQPARSSVEHRAVSGTDVASSMLEPDDGERLLPLVRVGADGTVCDLC